MAPRGRTGPLLTQMQGVGALGGPQTSHTPGLSFQMGRPWLILGQSFPGLATCALSPKAPTLPQHLLLLFPLPSDGGQASFPLQDQTGTQPAASPRGLTGYKDKLTAKGKALYRWGRHVSEEWAEPGARGAGTGVSQRQMCPGTWCSPTAGSSPATYSLGVVGLGQSTLKSSRGFLHLHAPGI